MKLQVWVPPESTPKAEVIQDVRLFECDHGTVLVVMCDEKGAALSNGHLMRFGPRGFWRNPGVGGLPDGIDDAGRIAERERSSQVC